MYRYRTTAPAFWRKQPEQELNARTRITKRSQEVLCFQRKLPKSTLCALEARALFCRGARRAKAYAGTPPAESRVLTACNLAERNRQGGRLNWVSYPVMMPHERPPRPGTALFDRVDSRNCSCASSDCSHASNESRQSGSMRRKRRPIANASLQTEPQARMADVDAFWKYLRGKGFVPGSPLDASWGERYFHMPDPDGHELSFARPI